MMSRAARLPTRVNKACDRCRRQKQRCDFERPCRHCEHARTECITTAQSSSIANKSRARRLTGGQTIHPPLDRSIDWNSSSSRPHTAESSIHLGLDGNVPIERVWSPANLSNPSVVSDTRTQTSSPHRGQLHRDNSNIPEFDADSALAITRKIFRSQNSPNFREGATFAIPGGRHNMGTNSINNIHAPLVLVVEIIGIELPPFQICNQLLETYFSAVHWFSLVVYEPKFRVKYVTISSSGLASRSDRGFLILLCMVLIMGCWYASNNATREFLPGKEADVMRNRLLKVVQSEFMDLMDEESKEFVQLCTLLGSFYLYHGKPRSSFSILGAATKTAQAMNLHRDSDANLSFQDKEERKRIWWTIYTWDRFATITYGRPLSINDKDCNVPMPLDLQENVHFESQHQSVQICLSTYQRELNQIYKIASPLLEDIYGIRASHNGGLYSQLPEMVAKANQGLLEWQQALPHHLCCDDLNDLTSYSTAEEKMHSLQALSLQLTYDNLMIVLHRPLLAGRGPMGDPTITEAQTTSPNSQYSDDMRETGFRRCLKSALRISNLQRKQTLFALAGTTHLVSFLGMNLFTASVVLFICALSDTLSDTAQEAKRGLKRTLQMQKALARYASLSMQCGNILEDLVHLILKKEMEEMLHDDQDVYPNLHAETLKQNENADGQDETTAGNGNFHVMPPPPSAASHVEGSHFNQSLRTLQKVFHDSSVLRQHGESASTSRNESGEVSISEQNGNPAGWGSSHDYTFGVPNFTGVEDLGQFWLWNPDSFNI